MLALVTGGAGFIGTNLVEKLIKQKWSVVIVDNLSTGRRENLTRLDTDDGVRKFICSYGDDDVTELIRSHQFDAVFHLGAIPRVAYSVEFPTKTHENNVLETLKLMDACRINAGRFVFASSSSVLGDVDTFPTVENMSRRPLSPYGIQKSVIEDYCRVYTELYGMETVSLRFFNVYGPHQYGDSAYSTVISAWCQAIHDGRPLRLDGSGDQSRDFCYVDNVTDAMILAATSKKVGELNSQGISPVFNIAHGENHTINHVLDLFKQNYNNKFDVIRADGRKGDVFKTHASIQHAHEVLNYSPTVLFEEGLQRTWDWWSTFDTHK